MTPYEAGRAMVSWLRDYHLVWPTALCVPGHALVGVHPAFEVVMVALVVFIIAAAVRVTIVMEVEYRALEREWVKARELTASRTRP